VRNLPSVSIGAVIVAFLLMPSLTGQLQGSAAGSQAPSKAEDDAFSADGCGASPVIQCPQP
jgi:hypothetical protein